LKVVPECKIGAVSAVYGKRGRIGLIVPANNSVIEPELWSVLPPGVSLHATRILAKGDLTPQAIHRMESGADSAVEQIAATGVDVIAYCDMVTTFIMQAGWNESSMQRFSQATGVPCISAWTALRDALAKLGARRLAIGTPYPASIHELVAPFFQQRNFQVTSHATLDIVSMREVPTVDAARLKGLVKKLDLSGCDALLLLATDLPTFSSIASLESECGVPVLTSNQTILWRALSELGAATEVRNLGRLFT
jgi:maleate cis-trans isomerase